MTFGKLMLLYICIVCLIVRIFNISLIEFVIGYLIICTFAGGILYILSKE